MSFEQATEQQIYFPQLTSSGIGLAAAHWTFKALKKDVLHVDRDLHLLIALPDHWSKLEAKFVLRAQVALNGLVGLVPLVGERRVTIETVEEF